MGRKAQAAPARLDKTELALKALKSRPDKRQIVKIRSKLLNRIERDLDIVWDTALEVLSARAPECVRAEILSAIVMDEDGRPTLPSNFKLVNERMQDARTKLIMAILSKLLVDFRESATSDDSSGPTAPPFRLNIYGVNRGTVAGRLTNQTSEQQVEEIEIEVGDVITVDPTEHGNESGNQDDL